MDMPSWTSPVFLVRLLNCLQVLTTVRNAGMNIFGQASSFQIACSWGRFLGSEVTNSSMAFRRTWPIYTPPGSL